MRSRAVRDTLGVAVALFSIRAKCRVRLYVYASGRHFVVVFSCVATAYFACPTCVRWKALEVAYTVRIDGAYLRVATQRHANVAGRVERFVLLIAATVTGYATLIELEQVALVDNVARHGCCFSRVDALVALRVGVVEKRVTPALVSQTVFIVARGARDALPVVGA